MSIFLFLFDFIVSIIHFSSKNNYLFEPIPRSNILSKIDTVFHMKSKAILNFRPFYFSPNVGSPNVVSTNASSPNVNFPNILFPWITHFPEKYLVVIIVMALHISGWWTYWSSDMHPSLIDYRFLRVLPNNQIPPSLDCLSSFLVHYSVTDNYYSTNFNCTNFGENGIRGKESFKELVFED